MNGAEKLIKTLAANGVEVCFANPGTSEMHLVAAIDKQDNIKAVLGLFEGVVTGAADGYGRMKDKPAATLLHLGPGLANGLANLHNAKRARTPIINIIGDHADYHLKYDAPLTSDVKAVASPFSQWVGISKSADDLSEQLVLGLEQALSYPGQVASLIAPANHAWDMVDNDVISEITIPKPAQVSILKINETAKALQAAAKPVLYLGARALREDALIEAAKIATACGARLVCETFPVRLQRGAGRVKVERLPYFGELAKDFMQDFTDIILVGAKPPVSFFAYPDKPSEILPETANVINLAKPREDVLSALRDLANCLNAPKDPKQEMEYIKDFIQAPMIAPFESGALNPVNLGALIGKYTPKNAIIVDESNTCGLAIFPMTAGAKKHDFLSLTGGSIGYGLPAALGAAIACPNQKTICLQADGSAMYTVQALWTMARENLDVTILLINNGSYAILNVELARVGVKNPGKSALSLLDLGNPDINWVDISKGLGVDAVRVETTEEMEAALSKAMAQKSPFLIEAIIPAMGG